MHCKAPGTAESGTGLAGSQRKHSCAQERPSLAQDLAAWHGGNRLNEKQEIPVSISPWVTIVVGWQHEDSNLVPPNSSLRYPASWLHPWVVLWQHPIFSIGFHLLAVFTRKLRGFLGWPFAHSYFKDTHTYSWRWEISSSAFPLQNTFYCWRDAEMISNISKILF